MRSSARVPLAWFAVAVLCVALLLLLPGDTGLAVGRLAVTLPLALLTLVVALLVGGTVTLLLAAMNASLEVVLRSFSLLPAFAIGLLLTLVLSRPGLLPTGGFVPWERDVAGALRSLLLPALALGLPHGLALAHQMLLVRRQVSTGALETLQLQGMSERMARRRLRGQALGTVLPGLVGRHFGAIVAGTAVVESLFYLPGLGRQMLGAATARELPLLLEGLGWLLAIAASGMLLAALLRRPGHGA